MLRFGSEWKVALWNGVSRPVSECIGPARKVVAQARHGHDPPPDAPGPTTPLASPPYASVSPRCPRRRVTHPGGICGYERRACNSRKPLMETPKTFAVRMSETFRDKSKPATEFMAELRALTYEDKVWFANQFNKEGMPTEMPKPQ